MAPSESKIKEARAELLKGLDEDTLEYVAEVWTTRTAPSSKKTISWTSSPMLEEMLCGGDEDAARAKAESSGTGSAAGDSAAPPPAPAAAPEARARPSRWAAAPSAPWRRRRWRRRRLLAKRTPRPLSCTTTTSEGRRARPPRRKPRGPRRDARLAETAAAEAAELRLSWRRRANGRRAHAHRRRSDGVAARRHRARPVPAPQPRRRRGPAGRRRATRRAGAQVRADWAERQGRRLCLGSRLRRAWAALAADVSVCTTDAGGALDDAQEDAFPAEVVLQADVERRL